MPCGQAARYAGRRTKTVTSVLGALTLERAYSTGVVEAGCKVAIGTRLKRAGMHWTVAGADAIIALRCCKLSGRFEDFWERRAVSGR